MRERKKKKRNRKGDRKVAFECKKCWLKRQTEEVRKRAEEGFKVLWDGLFHSYGPCEDCRQTALCAEV